MIDPNRKYRRRMRIAAVVTLCYGIGVDILLFLLTDWRLPLVSAYGVFLGGIFITLGDVSGVRYMELRPDGVMQKYLFWRKLIPWENFRQIGSREYSGRMGKEYRHSLVFLQRKDESVCVSELFSPSRAFSALLICPDSQQARDYIERQYGPLDFDCAR